MVLVSNEWLNKGDEVHKPGSGSSNASANETIGIITTTATTTTISTTETIASLTNDSTTLEALPSTIPLRGSLSINNKSEAETLPSATVSAKSIKSSLKGANNYLEVNHKKPPKHFKDLELPVIVDSGTVTLKNRKKIHSRSIEKNANITEQQISKQKPTVIEDQTNPKELLSTEKNFYNPPDNNLNCSNNSSTEASLLTTIDAINKALLGTDNISLNITSQDINSAIRNLNIDNFCNATTHTAGAVGGQVDHILVNNTLPFAGASGGAGGSVLSGTIPSISNLPSSISAINKRQTISSAGTSAICETGGEILGGISICSAGTANNGASGGSNKLPNTFLSSLGMGVATNNMQTQQQSIINNSKTFSTNSSTNIGTTTAPNNNNNNTLSNNNGLSLSFSNSNVGTNNINIMSNQTSNSTAGASYASINDNNNNQAKIILICEANSHPFQTRTISLTPNIECKVGRLIAKTKANDSNAIFDCKVLSRNHAVLWYSDDGKFWVKDTKSSNGTFINDNKLGNDAAELHFGDIVKFGVDVYENSRQESHGCIIACVKLFLPDGREAISIDGHSSRSSVTTEGRITFEEMHRLNMYMQEAAQREKCLKTKLCSIQNVLDSTRKNSALCWQAMINEDQLIHRINSLEKKLQIVEKNVPESVLRNEVLKLIDDKNTYQITAKEALRKVYQERCDALQMLAKVESAYATAENECTILRDEIVATKQTMQEIHTRLIKMETEYNEYKDEIDRQQSEAKLEQDDLIKSLKEQLKEREHECDKLQNEVKHLQSVIAASSTKTQLQKDNYCDDDDEAKQAIEKLDAAIGGFIDFTDNDDDDEEHYENNEGCNDELDALNSIERALQDPSSPFNGQSDKKNKESKQDKDAMQKVIRKSTVMKWLKNSDLNKEKGSMDIFKAMFEDVDDTTNDEYKGSDIDFDQNKDNKITFGAGAIHNLSSDQLVDTNDFNIKYKHFKSVMENVFERLERFIDDMIEEANQRQNFDNPKVDEFDQKCLNEIQEEIGGGGVDTISGELTATLMSDINDGDVRDYVDDVENAAEEFIKYKTDGPELGSNDETAIKDLRLKKKHQQFQNILSKQSQSFLQLKKSFEILREAYNDLGTAFRPNSNNSTNSSNIDDDDEKQNKFDKQYTLKPNEDSDTQKYEDTDDTGGNETENDTTEIELNKSYQSGRFSCASSDADSEFESKNQSVISKNKYATDEADRQYEDFKAMQEQIEEMKTRLHQTETDANHTLEIMQIECDTYKMKMNDMQRTIEKLTDENQELQDTLAENNIKIVPANKSDPNAGLNKLSTSGSYRAHAASSSNMPINTNASLKFGGLLGSSLDYGVDNSGGGLTTSGISDLHSSQSDNKFEADLAEDRVAAMDLEREEELIVFKERLAKEQQANHNLLVQLESYKKHSSGQVLVRNLVPLGVVAIAAIVYFATQYF